MRRFVRGAAAITCYLLFGHTLQAHHSLAATYDIRGQGEITGVLTRVAFTNPHDAMHLDVANEDGSTTEWVMTTGSANTLANLGFCNEGPNNVKAGDSLTITFFPARNGRPLGFIRSITFPDDRMIEFEPE